MGWAVAEMPLVLRIGGWRRGRIISAEGVVGTISLKRQTGLGGNIRMSPGVQIAIAIISPVAAIAAAVIALMRVLGRPDRRLDHIEIISTTVENQNRALLTAFPSVISSLIRASIMTADQGTNLMRLLFDAKVWPRLAGDCRLNR